MLLLQGYMIDKDNFNMFVEALSAYIPNSLQKIAFCDNQLKDDQLAMFWKKLATLETGPKMLAVIQNAWGFNSLRAFLVDYMNSEAAVNLQRLAIKDPIIKSAFDMADMNIGHEIFKNSKAIYNLKYLTLQNIHMSKTDLTYISHAVTQLSSLKSLNLSGNKLKQQDFLIMFDILKP